MTGEKEPKKILKRLQAKYPNADFVLTYGEKGAWYVGNGETVYCPAKKVKVIDTTAAGDTFTGYFLSARGRGYGVEESLKKLQLRQERQLREKEPLYLFPVGKNWKKNKSLTCPGKRVFFFRRFCVELYISAAISRWKW
ncbi:MAG: PfkB family carbohydrate kinase [Lachnospiraceae bacterium]